MTNPVVCLSQRGAGKLSLVADDNDESLEDAVKGIASGIAGKMKEVAGELMEDPELEEEGIAQQEQAEELRSGNSE
jgi:uncharacterized protein YjbJ (UPF0337 family)